MMLRTSLVAVALLVACGGAISVPPSPLDESASAPAPDDGFELSSARELDAGPEVAALVLAPAGDAGEPVNSAAAASPDAGLAADAGGDAAPTGPTPEQPVIIDCRSAHDCELCRQRVAIDRPDWLESGAVQCVQRQ